tara:strand:+ start:8648 stop:9061 length:414 start_codon:yes stop_codon:yes gene_type:complete
MSNKEIIKILLKEFAKKGKKDYGTIPRYLFLLNNYLKGKDISVVERENHPDNNPRAYSLEVLANGFSIKIDLKSDLFKDRLDTKKGPNYWLDDSGIYKRFFKRLEYLKERHSLTEDMIIDSLNLGDIVFNKKYKEVS